MSRQTQSTRLQAGVKCGVHRHTRIKAPFPLRRLTFPLQSPRSAALLLPRICGIHRHLGIGCDFRRGFICTLTSITSFSSVTVCFALNLLLFSFTPRFALFQSLPFIAQSAQWGAQQSGSTDTREWKSISFLLPFYHLCPFFFFVTSHPTLSYLLPFFSDVIINAIADFFLIWYVPFFFPKSAPQLCKKKKKKKEAIPIFRFLLGRLGRTTGWIRRRLWGWETFRLTAASLSKWVEVWEERTRKLEWRKDPQIKKGGGKRKTFPIQRDTQCFRGNSVSIETILLKMPLVQEEKKIPYLHSTALYAHKYRNILHLTRQGCIFAAARGGWLCLLT